MGNFLRQGKWITNPTWEDFIFLTVGWGILLAYIVAVIISVGDKYRFLYVLLVLFFYVIIIISAYMHVKKHKSKNDKSHHESTEAIKK